ncbi:MAG: carbon monoxide dehydrogenase subunit G [Ktedonobacteraceae bacterium]
MDIEGTYTLQAAPEDVWQCLIDPQALRQSIPDMERLTRIDEHTYEVALHVRQAPLLGFYQGRVLLSSLQPPASYHIAVTGEGSKGIGAISGEGTVQLSSHGNNTVVTYHGTLHLAKPESLLPSPLVKGAARLLLQQFFTALADYLRAMQPVTIVESAEWVAAPASEEADKETPPLLQRVVRVLRLGNGEPAREEQWTRAAKRVGAVLALVFLVWVGTRLPRRTIY